MKYSDLTSKGKFDIALVFVILDFDFEKKNFLTQVQSLLLCPTQHRYTISHETLKGKQSFFFSSKKNKRFWVAGTTFFRA